MGRQRWGVILLLIGWLALGACARARGASPAPVPGMEKGMVEAPVALSVPPGGVTDEEVRSWNAAQDAVPSDEERLVIRNASLTIVVQDPEAGMEALIRLAGDLGGYVVSSEISTLRLDNGREVPQASVRLRVPAERFNEALEAIRKQAVRVSSESISGQDVTEEYVDLQARIKNLRAAAQQLQEIMQIQHPLTA